MTKIAQVRQRSIPNYARQSVRHFIATVMLAIMIAPSTFGGVGIPMEAMNVGLSGASLRHARRHSFQESPNLSLTWQPVIVSNGLQPDRAMPPTIERTTEQFFATEVPYGAIIYREARRNHLPPELIAAVVEAESDFRPRLVSNKSQQGLMQIVPETSRLLGCENPFDPAQNIAAGSKYLRYLVDRFGDQRMALAAYNAGEGNIERFGGIPPFSEMHDYLERVGRHASKYRLTIGNRFRASAHLRVGA